MSSPIIISLFCKGRQKDYKAIFSDNGSVYEFKVIINDKTISFEGGIHETFTVKSNGNEPASSQTDTALLEAVKEQLNQIFW